MKKRVTLLLILAYAGAARGQGFLDDFGPITCEGSISGHRLVTDVRLLPDSAEAYFRKDGRVFRLDGLLNMNGQRRAMTVLGRNADHVYSYVSTDERRIEDVPSMRLSEVFARIRVERFREIQRRLLVWMAAEQPESFPDLWGRDDNYVLAANGFYSRPLTLRYSPALARERLMERDVKIAAAYHFLETLSTLHLKIDTVRKAWDEIVVPPVEGNHFPNITESAAYFGFFKALVERAEVMSPEDWLQLIDDGRRWSRRYRDTIPDIGKRVERWMSRLRPKS